MCKLEGHSWKDSFRELNNKFVATFILDLAIWPGAQALNFYYVPPPLRLMYLNGIYLIWSIILSYLKHNVSLSLEYISSDIRPPIFSDFYAEYIPVGYQCSSIRM